MGVAIAATIIYTCSKDKDDLTYVVADPICTFVFSAIVFFTVTPIMKKCVNVLMEAAPSGISVDALIKDIKKNTNSSEIHDFHLWQISIGKFALSCHINSTTPMETLK